MWYSEGREGKLTHLVIVSRVCWVDMVLLSCEPYRNVSI